MPQDLRVVKCYKCSTFQVDIVKKAKKWHCKMCGEKQSIQQEYGRGTGAECRLHVQKLNLKHKELGDAKAELVENLLDGTIEVPTEFIEAENEEFSPVTSSRVVEPHNSKWQSFVEEPEGHCSELNKKSTNWSTFQNINNGSTQNDKTNISNKSSLQNDYKKSVWNSFLEPDDNSSSCDKSNSEEPSNFQSYRQKYQQQSYQNISNNKRQNQIKNNLSHPYTKNESNSEKTLKHSIDNLDVNDSLAESEAECSFDSKQLCDSYDKNSEFERNLNQESTAVSSNYKSTPVCETSSSSSSSKWARFLDNDTEKMIDDQ